jgi:hypothetical protein
MMKAIKEFSKKNPTKFFYIVLSITALLTFTVTFIFTESFSRGFFAGLYLAVIEFTTFLLFRIESTLKNVLQHFFILFMIFSALTVFSYHNGFSRGKEELAMDQYELDLSRSKESIEQRQELRKLKKENYQLQYRNQYLEYWFDNVTCVCGCSDTETETEQDLSL